ncbi:MAG: right-handed parallel beta-helix repeat-containing protein [Candidatus Paceibacterota bacterium]
MKKQHLLSLALTFVLLFGGPLNTEAQFIDPMVYLKEWGTDAVAWFIGGLMTGELTRSTTSWVNEGFGADVRGVEIDPDTGRPVVANFTGEGGASFVVNPGAFFQGLTVKSANTFYKQFNNIANNPDEALNTIFPGFRDDLLREIARETQGMTGNFFEDFVSDIEEDELDAYLNDFSAGGWDMFLRTTQNCANNYSCARIAVLSELDSRVNQVTSEAQADLQQGGGFLTMRRCVETSETSPDGCAKYENVTPGQLVGEQITKATTVEFDRYTEMDELTEILVTLLEQALNTMIRQGLSSLTGTLFEAQNIDAQYADLKDQVDTKVDEAGEIGDGGETETTPTAQTSCVSASGDSVCTISSNIDLTATFTSDSNLTTTWSKVSGPGTVTFANSSSTSTTATFSQSGTYVLRFSASDGALSVTDDVTVVVNSEPAGAEDHTLGPQVVPSTALGLGTHFTSPQGSGTSCSSANPCTLQTAASQASAGSVIFLRGGTYPLTAQLSLTTSGTSNNPVTFESYPGERATIDGQRYPETRVRLAGNYIVLRNLNVTRMESSAGVYILNGNNNLVDGVHSYNNRYSGFGIYTPYESYPYTQGSNNVIRNCVAYGNSDVGIAGGANGGNSDGVSISSGNNNKVLNCLVYGNSDDGIDAWRSTNSEFAYNIIHSNGLGGGNGNGIKAGGPAPGNGALVHHNISYNNKSTGIDQNNGTGISFFNNVSWDNNSGYVIGSDTVVRNNVSLGNSQANSGTGIASNNTWNGGFSVSSADFESINPSSDFFFVLKLGSSLVNAGINVGFSFEGSAPDVGAVEFSS